MKKLIAFILLIVIVVIAYKYIYRDHRDISAENPEFTVEAKSITHEFKTNNISTEKKYLNKTIAITGEVSEINSNDVTLNSTVFCKLIDSLREPLVLHHQITLKGRLIGYDDLLEQVKLDQCVIIY